MATQDFLKLKTLVAALSIASNLILVAGKLAIGLLVNSVSVISEAIHSGVDLIAAIIAFISVRNSGKPADDEHPYGHGKIENLSGLIEAVLIFVAAAWIVKEAIYKLLHPEPTGAIGWAVLVMMGSAIINVLISSLLMSVGKKTDSMALRADAWHLRTDVYTSAGVMVALAIMWLLARLAPGADFAWIDPVVAMLVACLIVKAAWDLTRESVRDLLDVRLAPSEEDWIRDYVKSHGPLIRSFHRLRTRKAGHMRFIEFHLAVDGEMSVAESHRISDDIIAAIREHLAHAHVTVHVEPCDNTCRLSCLSGCFRPETERLHVTQ